MKPSRDDLADIARSWPEAIVGETLDGVVTSWNRAAEELYGYGADEIVGRPVDRLYPPGNRGDEAAILRHLARGRWLDRHVAERVRADGATITVSLRAAVIVDGSGIATGIVSMSRDVRTGRRAGAAQPTATNPADMVPIAVVGVDATGTVALSNPAAERLLGYERAELIGAPLTRVMPGATPADRPLLEGLRQLLVDSGAVAARRRDGAELTVDVDPSATEGEELVMAIRAAVEPGGTLSAGLCHQLRTPLQAIIGFTGTLLMRMPGPLNDEQERQLLLVQASAQQLLTLINQLGRPDQA